MSRDRGVKRGRIPGFQSSCPQQGSWEAQGTQWPWPAPIVGSQGLGATAGGKQGLSLSRQLLVLPGLKSLFILHTKPKFPFFPTGASSA